MSIPFLDGEKIALAPLEKDSYCRNMAAWVHDDEATRYMLTGVFPMTHEALQQDYDRIGENKADIVLAVIRKADDAMVGTAGLYGIAWQARNAEFRIFLGDRSAWNGGLGSEAAALMVQYAFDRLNLNKVWLGVNEENKGAIKSYENAGFALEGTLREEVYRNGRYYDALRMSLLRADWSAD
jgi:RimJ/RimL family protein N-acetyltransferase